MIGSMVVKGLTLAKSLSSLPWTAWQSLHRLMKMDRFSIDDGKFSLKM
jgi:hypothetical protein